MAVMNVVGVVADVRTALARGEVERAKHLVENYGAVNWAVRLSAEEWAQVVAGCPLGGCSVAQEASGGD
jgi:hypothetical protein